MNLNNIFSAISQFLSRKEPEMVSPWVSPEKKALNELLKGTASQYINAAGRSPYMGYPKSEPQRQARNQKIYGEQPTSTPTPMPTIPPGTDLAMDYLKDVQPRGQSFEQAYPAMGNQEFVSGVEEADELKQGLSNLLFLIGNFESNLGRASPNIFGVKPEGASGTTFSSPQAALEYQLGPSVMSGGANPNMNIIGSTAPMNRETVENFYSSYDPPGAYLDDLLDILFPGNEQ